MGQYVQIGVCTQITISKEEVESKNIEYDAITDILKKEVDLKLYELEEDEKVYKFVLKEENYGSEGLAGFLTEQYRLFLDDNELELTLNEVLPALEKNKSRTEILELASDRRYQYFQGASYMESVKCGAWNRITVEYNTIVFFLQGKIMMECYDDFMLYIENLIRKSSEYKISGAVKAFIE